MLLHTISWVVRILTRVRFLIYQELDESIESTRDTCAQHWPQPIYPVIPWETPGHNLWAKTPDRIEARTGEVRTTEMGDEEGEPNANRGKKRGLGLLDCEHEHGDNKQGG